MGNFNIDLMNLVSANQNILNSNTLRFLECPLSHGVCLIPSRIADKSYSRIDNIFHLKVLLVHMSFLMIHLITAYLWLIFRYISHIMKRSQQSEETLGKKCKN